MILAHLVKPAKHPEGAQRLHVASRCRACAAPVDLLEMHYLSDDDGSVVCSPCSSAWSAAMERWRCGLGPMPLTP
jgi:hypothetical protein